MNAHRHRFSRAWLGALAVFVLAGSTGALLRFGLLYGFPADLQYMNVRHAHSHLMYFGWVTPALLALIAARLLQIERIGEQGWQWAPRFGRVIVATFVLALLAYTAFLFYGYQPAVIAGRRLPLSTMAAGGNMLAWYAFIAVYLRATWRLRRNHCLRLWDAALAFLILASLGAWGLAVVGGLKINNTLWSLALTHLFLDLFADGWLVLALLGLAYAALPAASGQQAAQWGEGLVLMGLPVTFLLSLPAGMLPPGVRLLAGAGGVLVGLGLLLNLWALWPAARQALKPAWTVPLIFLGVKGIAELGLSLPAVAQWAEAMGLRLSYLHWLLLGFVTLGLVAAAADVWGRAITPGWRWLTVAVLLLLISLLPLTRLWPPVWGGRWALVAAAWSALGPVIAGSAMLVTALLRQHATRQVSVTLVPPR